MVLGVLTFKEKKTSNSKNYVNQLSNDFKLVKGLFNVEYEIIRSRRFGDIMGFFK